jgi:hypothetical protein
MRASGFIVIVLALLLIYYVAFHTHTSEIFGVSRPVDPPQVHYFGDFQDPQRFTIGMLGGVHGNEPAGSVALQALIDNGWFARNAREQFNFIVIPRANEYGLMRNQRWTGSPTQPDLNRSFHERYTSRDTLSKHILEAFADTNLVMDFHEGWGWHVDNRASVGSTLSPTRTNSNVPLERMSADIVNVLNTRISDPKRKFVSLDDISCDILSALSCYMERNGRDYILMETTGQKNIQPMDVRVNQVHMAIEKAVDILRDQDCFRS